MSKKLYVGNLSYQMTEDSLRQVFAAVGEVLSAKIVTDAATGRSRGFGFVEMAEADRLAVAGGIPSIALMENAGRAVADAASRILQGPRVVVVAGPGNNGGDGFVAARYLAERGLVVSVCFVGKRERLKGDAALTAQRWNGPVSEPSPAAFADCDLIIDALFGAGLDRDVEGPARNVIDLMNNASASIVAVDLPSGVNGTTGAVMGCAVNAQLTVTFFKSEAKRS